MRYVLSLLSILSFSWTISQAQLSYLKRPDLLEKVEACLHYTYSFNFTEARDIHTALHELTPGHPTPHFLEALIVYWENFPLTPSMEASANFIELMDRSVDLSKALRKDSLTYTEGVFFDLFGRAFTAMFWADNGKSAKLIPDLGNMYRFTKKGFELTEQFDEFYFSTGLYNYYIEAYPETHPGYKPMVAFMHKGDRTLGLEQLVHAINHTVFLKVEATLFMSLIQLNYEKDLNSAAVYAEKLVSEYPRNIFYQGHLINILLHQHRYEEIKMLLQKTASQDDSYSEMIRTLASAFLAEKESGDENRARAAYTKTIEQAKIFGPFADIYQAMGYMGLSRLFEKNGLFKESKNSARKAARLTNYSFILEE